MDIERKSSLSMTLATLAVAIAGTTLYVAHLHPAELAMAIPPGTYVSNTRGGLPDLYLAIALSAKGPSSKSLSVRSLRGDLTRIEDGKPARESVELVSSPKNKDLPTILHGGDVVNLQVLLVSSELGSAEIARYNWWCDRLRDAFPERKDEVEDIRRMLRRLFFVNPFSSGVGDPTDEDLTRSLTGVDGRISELLKDGEVEKLQQVLFFRAGMYRLKIEALLEDGTAGAMETRVFSIDETASEVLLRRFNTNFYVRLVDPSREKSPV